MRAIHLVVPDLWLPPELARPVGAGLALPVLERMLARADAAPLACDSLEDWLCDAFGVQRHAVAPVTAAADGLPVGEGFWLRAEPVHLQLRINEVVLQSGLDLTQDEAGRMVESLNRHFEQDGLVFLAPHPGRWYLRLSAPTDLRNEPPALVHGENVRERHMQGDDALRWNRMLAELQMLLYHHPVNEAREARGALPVSSVWLWGAGQASTLVRPARRFMGDDELARAFAVVAGMAVGEGDVGLTTDSTLWVWGGLRRAVLRGDMAAWRDSVVQLEQACLAPVWQALRSGAIDRVTLDVPHPGGARRFELGRRAGWRFWRAVRPLADYSGG